MSELFEKMKAAQTVEEVLDLAAENGLEMTANQAKEFFEKKDTLELTDKDLDAVAGGDRGQAFLKGSAIIIKWDAGTKMNDIWAQMEPFKVAITARGVDYEAVKNHIRAVAHEYMNFVNFSFRYYAANGTAQNY